MERLRFHSTGEEDEYHPTRPLNSEAGIMQELKPESTNNDTEEANKAGSSTVGGALKKSASFAHSSSSTTYDPSKPGIRSLAVAKEAREQEKNDRIAQLEADLSEAINSRDRTLQSLRKAQDVRSAAIALLKTHKSEIDQQQQSDPLAWSRALEHAQQFIRRIENVLSGDGQKILSRHENSMRKVYDCMNELRASVAKMEAAASPDTDTQFQRENLDKEAMAKEIDMLRTENASLRERNALMDFNSENYHSIHDATDVQTQLRQRAAQLAATKSQLHRSQQTTKMLVATIRQLFQDSSDKSDAAIIEEAERDARPAFGHRGNEPPQNRALQESSGGKMYLNSETTSHLQRLAQSPSFKRQTSLKQLFEDFSVVPLRKGKTSTQRKPLPHIGSSSSPMAAPAGKGNKNSKARDNTGKAQEILREQINILADEVVRLCYLLGRAEVQALQQDEASSQNEKKGKKKSKVNAVPQRWKREIEEKLEAIEACFGESSSAVLSVLSIAQDSLRMITEHCAEAERRMSATSNSLSTENQQLRTKIAKLERVLQRVRKPTTSDKIERTRSGSQLTEKSSRSTIKKPSESNMKSPPLRKTKSFASPSVTGSFSEEKNNTGKSSFGSKLEEGTTDHHIHEPGSNSPEPGYHSNTENTFDGTPTYSEDSAKETFAEYISSTDSNAASRLDEIRREGEQLLPELKQWESEFQKTYGREPTQSEKFSGPLGDKYYRFKELAKEMKNATGDSSSRETDSAS